MNFTVLGSTPSCASAEVSFIVIAFQGSSHPYSSQATICSGGSGARFNRGRCAFRTKPAPESPAPLPFPSLPFEKLTLAAPR